MVPAPGSHPKSAPLAKPNSAALANDREGLGGAWRLRHNATNEENRQQQNKRIFSGKNKRLTAGSTIDCRNHWTARPNHSARPDRLNLRMVLPRSA
jgi:hypothetical protein